MSGLSRPVIFFLLWGMHYICGVAAFTFPTSTGHVVLTRTCARDRDCSLPSSSSTTAVWMTPSNKKKKNTPEGVYTRPSAAIEKGSGFFMPGLEGPKVRLLFGLVVLLLATINHGGGGTDVAEIVAVVNAFLLLLQAAIEFGKEKLVNDNVVEEKTVYNRKTAPATATRLSRPQWSDTAEMNEEYRERIEWCAASFLSLTPATDMILIQDNKILFRLSILTTDYGGPGTIDTSEAQGCQAALKTLSEAKTGRVSLPSMHPAVMSLAPASSRTVVLQTIQPNQCWMMASSQLLPSFTDYDLKWLGQLAIYSKL